MLGVASPHSRRQICCQSAKAQSQGQPRYKRKRHTHTQSLSRKSDVVTLQKSKWDGVSLQASLETQPHHERRESKVLAHSKTPTNVCSPSCFLVHSSSDLYCRLMFIDVLQVHSSLFCAVVNTRAWVVCYKPRFICLTVLETGEYEMEGPLLVWASGCVA